MYILKNAKLVPELTEGFGGNVADVEAWQSDGEQISTSRPLTSRRSLNLKQDAMPASPILRC